MKAAQGFKYCLAAAFVVGLVGGLSQSDRLGKTFSTLEQPPCVVRVRAEHQNGETEHGSGVLIRSDLVLTAHHVVRDRGTAPVLIEFKGGLVRKCEVIKENKKWDLALLQFDSVLFVPARPADKAAVKKQKVTICGFPGAGGYAEKEGRVVGFRSPDQESDPYLFVVSNRCESGMSGGPVFNQDGLVVGTLFGSLKFANCTGLDAIKEFINEQPMRRFHGIQNDSGEFDESD